MDTNLLSYLTFNNICGIASIIGAFISFYQCKQAKTAKDLAKDAEKTTQKAVNEFNEKIKENVRISNITQFKNTLDSISRIVTEWCCNKSEKRGKSIEKDSQRLLNEINELYSLAADLSDPKIKGKLDEISSEAKDFIENHQIETAYKVRDSINSLMFDIGPRINLPENNRGI